jgi:hypothetical protein
MFHQIQASCLSGTSPAQPSTSHISRFCALSTYSPRPVASHIQKLVEILQIYSTQKPVLFEPLLQRCSPPAASNDASQTSLGRGHMPYWLYCPKTSSSPTRSHDTKHKPSSCIGQLHAMQSIRATTTLLSAASHSRCWKSQVGYPLYALHSEGLLQRHVRCFSLRMLVP